MRETLLELSGGIIEKYCEDCEEVSYVWDWRNTHTLLGCYLASNGENISIKRYTANFRTMMQTSIDNGRTRRIRFVYVLRGTTA